MSSTFDDALSARLQQAHVLVTGAAGFIGSHVVETLLASGARVKAMVRYNSRNDAGWLRDVRSELPADAAGRLEIVAGDVTDAGLVAQHMHECTHVLHLAALIGIPYSYVAPASYVATNVQGTLNILEAARQQAIKGIVITSTSEVYGSARQVPIREDHPLVGQSPYSASKIAADQLAISYRRSFGLPVAVIRPFNTYGPRQSLRAVIPTIIAQVLADRARKPGGASLQIRLGATETVRDLTFAPDTAQGIVAGLLAADNPAMTADDSATPHPEVFNLGTGEGWSVAQIVEEIAAISGQEIRVLRDEARLRPASSEVTRLISDHSRMRDLLGWQPRWSLREGLEVTFRWFERKKTFTFESENYTI